MRNRKGQSEMITSVVFTAGVLASLLVIAVFITRAGYVGVGTMSAKKCEASLEGAYEWNKQTDKYTKMAKDAVDNTIKKVEIVGGAVVGGFVATGVGIAIGAVLILASSITLFIMLPVAIVFSVGIALNVYMSIVGSVVGVLSEPLKALFESIGKNLKYDTRTCMTANAQCIDKAPFVGTCLYRKMTETYYAAGGGKDYALDGFTMYNVTAEVEGPGTVYLNGSTICSRVHSVDGVAGVEDDTDGKGCKVTIDKVTEKTATIAMVAVCQRNGPENTQLCKCFPQRSVGHDMSNGLPNDDWVVRSAEYGDTEYKGCGHIPDSVKLDDDVTIYRTHGYIAWAGPNLTEEGEEYKLYTRIEGNKAVLSDVE